MRKRGIISLRKGIVKLEEIKRILVEKKVKDGVGETKKVVYVTGGTGKGVLDGMCKLKRKAGGL